MSVRITDLFLYPLKSARGISVAQVELDRFGPALDRRWMLVDADGEFLTQRTHARMAHLEVALQDGGIRVSAQGYGSTHVPQASGAEEVLEVHLWESGTQASILSGDASGWFSRFMEEDVRVVFLPEDRQRTTSRTFTRGHPISFADGYPILVISQASLEELNRRLESPVTVSRFRPNVVVDGCDPHEEDSWRRLRMGGVEFDGVKPCPRCALIRVDPETAELGSEPLATLSGYRRQDGHIWFGQNLVHKTPGRLAVGDLLEILHVGPPPVGPTGVVAETMSEAEE